MASRASGFVQPPGTSDQFEYVSGFDKLHQIFGEMIAVRMFFFSSKITEFCQGGTGES